MNWLGKIIGAFIGLWLAGPVGMLIGLAIGHVIDLLRSGRLAWLSSGNAAATQNAFFHATFSVMGHIAKADGQVSAHEIRMAENIMRQMQLTAKRRREAIDFFNEGKQAHFNLQATLTELYQACHWRRDLLVMFLEIQYQAAAADGNISHREQTILEGIATRLGFSPADLFMFTQGYQFGQQRRQQTGGQRTYTQSQTTGNYLDQAYQLLGITAEASDADVKRAYRRQMSKHHPDKLVSKGLPEEMIKLANERTQAIKSAYEEIRRIRNM